MKMLKLIKKQISFFVLTSLWLVLAAMAPALVQANSEKMGVHLLQTYELDNASAMFDQLEKSDEWHYITIPFSLDDLNKKTVWQDFMRQAKEHKIRPIVRLVSRFENGSWKIPNRKEVVDQLDFLASLDWPTSERYVIIFNEVNHANEWGGQLNPADYARTFAFAASWAHALDKNFVVLPAAMDLAANNSGETMDAFVYLEKMFEYDPEVFSYVDVWNSHSYPNPAFSASPEKTDRQSLRGFIHELAWLKDKTGQDFKVVVSETGWQTNSKTSYWLKNYYSYAWQHIYTDDRIIAVTPFVLQGAPGPFANFSFLDEDGKQTLAYQAYVEAVKSQK